MKIESLNFIEALYKSKTTRSFDWISSFGLNKDMILDLIMIYDFKKNNTQDTILEFAKTYLPNVNIENIKPEFESILNFYSEITNYKPSYIALLFADLYISQKTRSYYLPYNPVSGSNYIDLCTGIDFIKFLPYLQKDCVYHLFDTSQFACRCLEIKINHMSLSNVIVHNTNIMDINGSNFSEIIYNLGAVRAKNVYCYVPNFNDKIEWFKSIILKDGIFVFQESSDNRFIHTVANNHTNWDGWSRKLSCINDPICDDLDTLTFTKL